LPLQRSIPSPEIHTFTPGRVGKTGGASSVKYSGSSKGEVPYQGPADTGIAAGSVACGTRRRRSKFEAMVFSATLRQSTSQGSLTTASFSASVSKSSRNLGQSKFAGSFKAFWLLAKASSQ
jgi:hypothetical protein